MKVRALPKFEGIRDLERTEKEGKDIFPKAGDEWETSEERAKFLKGHGVVEIVEEKKDKKEEIKEEKEEVEATIEYSNEELKPKATIKKTTKKKKTSKK